MASRKALLLAGAAGAAVAYFADPQLGRTRRARTRDQLAAAVRRPARKAVDRADATAQRLADRSRGLLHEATTSEAERLPESDRVLADKVRSEVLGHEPWNGYVINVDAADGTVTLRGEVAEADHARGLEQAVGALPGVRRVENLLHLPGQSPANIRAAGQAWSRSD